MEKRLLDTLLRHLRHGSVKVKYWDGNEVIYGTDTPVCTVVFRNPRVVRAIFRNPSLGFSEGYMRGDIEIEGPLESVMALVALNASTFARLGIGDRAKRLFSARKSMHQENIASHYDLGNDFFALWLDTGMHYSSAIFDSDGEDLDVAQARKVTNALDQLQLSQDTTLLDIGSGWGDLLITAAKRYGLHGLGVTLSEEQVQYATDRAKREGVGQLVEFRLQHVFDLAKSTDKFDRIAAIESIEPIGRKHLGQYFSAIHNLSTDDALIVLQGSTFPKPGFQDDFLNKYIFPGGYAPAVSEILEHLANYQLQVLEFKSLRPHAVLTMSAWLDRFVAHQSEIEGQYGVEFYRMFHFYLASVKSSYAYGVNDVVQMRLSKALHNKLS